MILVYSVFKIETKDIFKTRNVTDVEFLFQAYKQDEWIRKCKQEQKYIKNVC